MNNCHFYFQVKLVKQKDIFEDRKCLFKQAENVSLEMGDSFDMDSPNYLIPPLKFDSTPRSRSQSVELPEAMLSIPPDQSRKLSLINSEQQESNVNIIVQPPTPQHDAPGAQSLFRRGPSAAPIAPAHAAASLCCVSTPRPHLIRVSVL